MEIIRYVITNIIILAILLFGAFLIGFHNWRITLGVYLMLWASRLEDKHWTL